MLSTLALALTLIFAPALRGSAMAVAEASARPALGCPGYEVLLRAASRALERGERERALARLREARSALDACARKAWSTGEAMIGLKAPEPDHRAQV